MSTLEARFWAKVRKTETCWEWTGATVHGYGAMQLGRRGEGKVYAHRVSWELANGPIPEGLHIDHLCRNRRCVRPAHLEPVTLAENNRRAAAYRDKSQCREGHTYPENVAVDRRGAQVCPVCRREMQDRRNARRDAQRRAEGLPERNRVKRYQKRAGS